MAEIELKFQKDEYLCLLEEEIELEDFLKSVLYEKSLDGSEGAYIDICTELLDYYSDEGGAPDLNDFEIVDSEYNEDQKKGKVWLEYEIFYSYGCSDINTSREYVDAYNFTIDVSSLTLTIDFPDKISRNTFEEF